MQASMVQTGWNEVKHSCNSSAMSFKGKLGQVVINVPVSLWNTMKVLTMDRKWQNITWLTVVNYKHHLCEQFCYLKEKPVVTTKYIPLYAWKEEVYLLQWGLYLVSKHCKQQARVNLKGRHLPSWLFWLMEQCQILLLMKKRLKQNTNSIHCERNYLLHIWSNKGRQERHSFSFYLQQIKESFLESGARQREFPMLHPLAWVFLIFIPFFLL